MGVRTKERRNSRRQTQTGNRQSMDGAINSIDLRLRGATCCGSTHALPLPWLCLSLSFLLLSSSFVYFSGSHTGTHLHIYIGCFFFFFFFGVKNVFLSNSFLVLEMLPYNQLCDFVILLDADHYFLQLSRLHLLKCASFECSR